MNKKYARRMANLKASEIRELLKLTEEPEVISFAGGLPAPELFPLEAIKRVEQLVLDESGCQALQYCTTEGNGLLRDWIAERMNRLLGTRHSRENILIVHGSQQALDLAGKVFLDEDDVILCESPTYLAAITAFRAYGCRFREIETDDEGMIPREAERALEELPRTKMIYTIPNFQNPTGRSWSVSRRKAIAALAEKYGVVIIEDNPYGELRFEGENLPAIQSFDNTGGTLATGTFSKIFCPGYRIAWIAGDEEVIQKFVLVKQGADLQCNTLAQMAIEKYLRLYDIDEHILKIREVYKHRRDLTMECMEKEFPPSVTFTRPEGGLFCWVELPENINAREVLVASLKENVAFVPGGSFFPNGGHENTFRINFSNMPEDRIIEGFRRLGGVLKTFI